MSMKEFLSEALTEEEKTLCAEAARIYEEHERKNDNGEKADYLQMDD